MQNANALKQDDIYVHKPAIMLPSNGTSSSLNYTKFSNTL